MSGGLDNGCRVDIRWTGDVSPHGSNRRVLWNFDPCPDVYPGIDTALESSNFSVSRLVPQRGAFLMP